MDEKKKLELKDLKPENKRKRKEPLKPWGRTERFLVLYILIATVFTASILATSARDFKLPGLPKLNFDFKSPFKNEVIVIGNNNSYSKIVQDFETKTRSLSGTYALYVVDLENNYSFGVNEEKLMQAASLIKLPVMLYVQGKIDSSKIEAMGKRSDNAVFIEIRKEYGDDVLQTYINSLGMKETAIVENTTTPKEIGDLLVNIYKNSNKEILDYLTNTNFENWLTLGLPENIRVSHKYGREARVVNDAGIVYTEHPYVIVIMTRGVVEKEADKVIPELSKLVYDWFNK